MFNFFKDEKQMKNYGGRLHNGRKDEKKTYTMDEHLKIKVASWIQYQREQLQNG